MKKLIFTLKILFVLAILVKPSILLAGAVDKNVDPKMVCITQTAEFEKKYKIKKHLLTTISNVETGRFDSEMQRMATWPWTVNVGGKGFYYKSKKEAIKAVKQFQKDGIKSIDVGCMQINLSYHKDAFKNLDEAFEPAINVEYGAKFLKKLHAEMGGDWSEAAKSYHSRNPEKSAIYNKKLVQIYKDIKPYIDFDVASVTKEMKATRKIKIASKFSRKNPVIREKKVDTSANEWRMAKLEEYNLRKASK